MKSFHKNGGTPSCHPFSFRIFPNKKPTEARLGLPPLQRAGTPRNKKQRLKAVTELIIKPQTKAKGVSHLGS